MKEFPFIYISSIMRTGSTVLQEALTQYPNSYIFHEPLFSQNKFEIPNNFLNDLEEKTKINISNELKNPSVKNLSKLIPKLGIKQIGIKEIIHSNWKEYLKYFPNIKFILTGRNPKDLYLSIYRWHHDKNGKNIKMFRKKLYSLYTIINEINKDFEMQKEIHNTGKSIVIKYENLCNDPIGTLSYIKDFIDSPIQSKTGEIGLFLKNHKKRINEYNIHKGKITKNKIGEWKTIKDSKLLNDILIFDNKMKDYKNFWGY